MAELRFKNVGNHVEDLADGRMIAPGEEVTLTDEDVRDPHNEDLVARGAFIGIDDKSEHEAQLAERRTGNREKKTASTTTSGEEE